MIDIEAVVRAYLTIFPDETAKLELLQKQLADKDNVQNRATLPGHICGSGIVLSPDHGRILLIHHKFLGHWLQPGGHWDPEDTSPLSAARRETQEETGIEFERYRPLVPGNRLVPIDIESHAIPANPAKGEPPHVHHDFRYVFIARSEKLVHRESEVSSAAWFVLTDKTVVDAGLEPVIAKLSRLAK